MGKFVNLKRRRGDESQSDNRRILDITIKVEQAAAKICEGLSISLTSRLGQSIITDIAEAFGIRSYISFNKEGYIQLNRLD